MSGQPQTNLSMTKTEMQIVGKNRTFAGQLKDFAKPMARSASTLSHLLWKHKPG